MSVETGQSAPDFTLQDATGKTVRLSDLRGKNIVLYFYPKDDTPGCTTEAQDFTALAGDFLKANTQVIGISKDSVAKHDKFTQKYNLDVTLVSDEAGSTTENYGVWVEKNMYGRKYMGIERSTFLIDAKGMVRTVWRKVKVKGHAQAVLEQVQELLNGS